jgi:predicted O-methyltransferase YrrM
MLDSVDLNRSGVVEAYINQFTIVSDPDLETAIVVSRENGLPDIQVSPGEGKLLYLLVKISGARRILEIGTLGGYSTLWLAKALPPDGHIITLEIDPKHAQVAIENVARAGLGKHVDVRIGKAIDTLPSLTGPFDLVFIDADKPSNPEYFAWALRLSHPGTVIIVDNVVRGGAVADVESQDAAVKGVQALFQAIAKEPRVEATAIQTVGAKGYDGFAVLRVV